MHMTFRHLNNKKASSISFISLFYETQNDTRKKLIFLGCLKFIHETFKMNAVYLDHSSTKSYNNMVMYILLFIYWIELILFWSSINSYDIYEINLDSNIWYQNFCLLYRFYIVTLSYSVNFSPLHNAFCLYISSLVNVFFLQKLSTTPLQFWTFTY